MQDEIAPILVDAAHRVWDRARYVVIRYLADDAEAAEILETVVSSVAASKNGHSTIQHIEAYLLKAVARESIRRRRRSDRLVFVDPATLERLAGAVTYNWDQNLDEAKRMELLRACLDRVGQSILDHLVLNYDWRFIADALGYANGHSAEVSFGRKVKKAIRRLRVHHGLLPTAEPQNSHPEML